MAMLCEQFTHLFGTSDQFALAAPSDCVIVIYFKSSINEILELYSSDPFLIVVLGVLLCVGLE
jgi:hypothetical protein